MNGYQQQIREPSNRQIPVSEYLELCAANKLPKYEIFPLY